MNSPRHATDRFAVEPYCVTQFNPRKLQGWRVFDRGVAESDRPAAYYGSRSIAVFKTEAEAQELVHQLNSVNYETQPSPRTDEDRWHVLLNMHHRVPPPMGNCVHYCSCGCAAVACAELKLVEEHFNI